MTVSCPKKMLRVAKSSSQALYVAAPSCIQSWTIVPIGLTAPYLRWQLDEIVKVSPPFGALYVLDIAWKAGIVGLVVDLLNLER